MGGSESCERTSREPEPAPAPKLELDKQWRNFDWGQKERLKTRLESVRLSNPDVRCIRILSAGQIGAGKSSFINSVNSVFQGEIVCEAQAANLDAAHSHSFTEKLRVHRIRNEDADLPFEICDIVGLDPKTLSGLQPDDVLKVIHGHVMEGYNFSQSNTDGSQYHNDDPSLSDQAFCLVYIIDANTVQFSADDKILIEKLRMIRQKLKDNDIPQVLIMTKVDLICPLVENDLRKVYMSKKIKEKMELCSLNVGVPMTSIFPVKNYHDEIDTNEDVDVLILKALDQIVRSANGRLRRGASNS